MTGRRYLFPPDLFPGGVPHEFAAQIEKAARAATGDDDAGRSPWADNFHGEGVAQLAIELGEAWDRLRRQPGVPGKPAASERAHIRASAFLLVAHCAHFQRPPPPELLDLVFRCLGLEHGRPSQRLLDMMRIPHVDRVDAYLRALEIDAAEPGLSTSELSRRIDVDRRTVARWRGQARYRQQLAARRHYRELAAGMRRIELLTQNFHRFR
jgi:transposase-like protein